MSNNIKRTSAVLMALLMLSGALASCSDSGSTDTVNEDTTAETTTVEETTTDDNPEPELPQLNYDGADFTYLIRGRNMSSYKELYIYQEELNGEVVNDTVVNRNGQVEDKFGMAVIQDTASGIL